MQGPFEMQKKPLLNKARPRLPRLPFQPYPGGLGPPTPLDVQWAGRRDSAGPPAGPNASLQTYYELFESRIGYRLGLSGTRHFRYYEKDTYWPFPVGRALRAMEEKLFRALGLPSGS